MRRRGFAWPGMCGPATIQAAVPGSTPVFFVAFPLAAPHGLTARALSPLSIDLAWQAGSGAPAGSGFIIERREALAATGPFTSWHELTRYVGTGTTLQDQHLAAGRSPCIESERSSELERQKGTRRRVIWRCRRCGRI